MTTLSDAIKIRDAVTAAGRPLTLTEACHRAVITRYRGWKAVQYGIEQGACTYEQIGAHNYIDLVPGTPPETPAAPTLAADANTLTVSWVAPDPGSSPIVDYIVGWENLTTPTEIYTVQVDGALTSVDIPQAGRWAVGETLAAEVKARSAVGESEPSLPGTTVVAGVRTKKPKKDEDEG